jgi:hypothetical protein
MSAHEPETGDRAGASDETSADYGYDLAHDARVEPHGLSTAPPSRSPAPTAPPDATGDYSYDLVHEVPPPRR